MKRIFNLMLMGTFILIGLYSFGMRATLSHSAAKNSREQVCLVTNDTQVANVSECLTDILRKEAFNLNYNYEDELEFTFYDYKPERVYNHTTNYSSVLHNKEIKQRNLLLKENNNILYLRKFAIRSIS